MATFSFVVHIHHRGVSVIPFLEGTSELVRPYTVSLATCAISGIAPALDVPVN